MPPGLHRRAGNALRLGQLVPSQVRADRSGARPVSSADWVEELCGHEIGRADQRFPARPWDTAHWVADVAKARDLLGWQPAYDLRTGLERTLAWFRHHQSQYRTRAHD